LFRNDKISGTTPLKSSGNKQSAFYSSDTTVETTPKPSATTSTNKKQKSSPMLRRGSISSISTRSDRRQSRSSERINVGGSSRSNDEKSSCSIRSSQRVLDMTKSKCFGNESATTPTKIYNSNVNQSTTKLLPANNPSISPPSNCKLPYSSRSSRRASMSSLSQETTRTSNSVNDEDDDDFDEDDTYNSKSSTPTSTKTRMTTRKVHKQSLSSSRTSRRLQFAAKSKDVMKESTGTPTKLRTSTQSNTPPVKLPHSNRSSKRTSLSSLSQETTKTSESQDDEDDNYFDDDETYKSKSTFRSSPSCKRNKSNFDYKKLRSTENNNMPLIGRILRPRNTGLVRDDKKSPVVRNKNIDITNNSVSPASSTIDNGVISTITDQCESNSGDTKSKVKQQTKNPKISTRIQKQRKTETKLLDSDVVKKNASKLVNDSIETHEKLRKDNVACTTSRSIQLSIKKKSTNVSKLTEQSSKRNDSKHGETMQTSRLQAKHPKMSTLSKGEKNTTTTKRPLLARNVDSDIVKTGASKIDNDSVGIQEKSENGDSSNDDDPSILTTMSVLNDTIGPYYNNWITLNWKNVPPNSNYQHYNQIDNMIANFNQQQQKKKQQLQQKEQQVAMYNNVHKNHVMIRTIHNQPMICVGESRFFATRYDKNNECIDLYQWVPYVQEQQAKQKIKYCSIYTPIPCNAMNESSFRSPITS
jgi:hypothetical protein